MDWFCTTPDSQWQQMSAGRRPAAPLDLTLTERRDQTWEGFGGCFNELGWIALSALPENERGKILRELFDPAGDCRFTIARMPIGASDYAAEWYSHDEDADDFAMEKFSIERDRKYLLPYIRAALAFQPELTLFASPWSPPTWMKFPRAYNFGTLIWRREILDAYALYFAKFVEAYREEGIRIHQVHVQNEPNSDQKFPSCLWTGEKMRDFIRDHLGPLFQTRGMDCEIWAGTIERNDFNNWAHTILSDAAARQFISGVGYQWAGQGSVQRTHQSWADLRLMQTENECGDGANTWDYALYVFDLFQHYITNGVNAYIYWNMVLAPGGRSTWGWLQNAMITIDPETRAVTYNPEFYVMKHFAHFIRPGARRIVLGGPWTGNAVAFENPDASTVIVIKNPSAEAAGVRLQMAGTVEEFELPGRSISTLVL